MPFEEYLDDQNTPRTIEALDKFGILEGLDDERLYTKVALFLRGVEVTLRDAAPGNRGKLFRLHLTRADELVAAGVRRNDLADALRHIASSYVKEKGGAG